MSLTRHVKCFNLLKNISSRSNSFHRCSSFYSPLILGKINEEKTLYRASCLDLFYSVKSFSKEANASSSIGTEKQKLEADSKKITLQGGVTVTDLLTGSGSPAKSGKMVTVYYRGTLKGTNEPFDSMTSGSGLTFRLGRGEVIDGWDIGLVGMRVGGKRVITCPPKMAYGSRGFPPKIPPNSTLVFEVELKAIK